MANEKTDLVELIEKVQEWADERGIYESSTALSQKLYMIGELANEVRDAIAKNKSQKEVMTEIGDVYVFAINWFTMCKCDAKTISSDLFPVRPEMPNVIQSPTIDACIDNFIQWLDNSHYMSFRFLYTICNILEVSRQECLELAYEKISKRKTRMQNGKAIKEV